MTDALDRFMKSLDGKAPARGLSRALQALWWDEKGNWNRAHAIVQEEEGGEGALVHAYLHRKEGDATNAAYWYRRARRDPARGPFRAEWRRIVESLLARQR